MKRTLFSFTTPLHANPSVSNAAAGGGYSPETVVTLQRRISELEKQFGESPKFETAPIELTSAESEGTSESESTQKLTKQRILSIGQYVWLFHSGVSMPIGNLEKAVAVFLSLLDDAGLAKSRAAASVLETFRAIYIRRTGFLTPQSSEDLRRIMELVLRTLREELGED